MVSKRRVELRSLKERKNDKWSSKQVLKHKNVPLCLPACLPACLGQASTHRDLQPASCPAAQTRPRLPTQFQAAQSWSNAWIFDGHSWIWKGLLTSSRLTLFCLTVCCSTSLLTYLLTCRIPCLCDTSYRVLNKNYQYIFLIKADSLNRIDNSRLRHNVLRLDVTIKICMYSSPNSSN